MAVSTPETREITTRLLCALLANQKFDVITPTSGHPSVSAAAEDLGDAFEKLHAKVLATATKK